MDAVSPQGLQIKGNGETSQQNRTKTQAWGSLQSPAKPQSSITALVAETCLQPLWEALEVSRMQEGLNSAYFIQPAQPKEPFLSSFLPDTPCPPAHPSSPRAALLPHSSGSSCSPPCPTAAASGVDKGQTWQAQL